MFRCARILFMVMLLALVCTSVLVSADICYWESTSDDCTRCCLRIGEEGGRVSATYGLFGPIGCCECYRTKKPAKKTGKKTDKKIVKKIDKKPFRQFVEKLFRQKRKNTQ